MKIEGAIFDLDGTLLDTMYVWNDIGINYVRSLGISVHGENLREIIRPLSLEQAAGYFKSEYKLTYSVQEIMNQINALVEDFYFNTATEKAQVKPFLEKLKERNVKMCIATATDRYLVERALERNGMLGYFSRIFTCTEVGKGKDEPDIYNLSSEWLGTDKENTYIFEDALYAVETAKRAGYKVVGIYDGTADAQTPEIKEKCDIYIKSYTELMNRF